MPPDPRSNAPSLETFTPLTNQARSTSAGQNAALESQEYHCNSSSLYRYLGVHFGIFSKACKTATSGQRVLDVYKTRFPYNHLFQTVCLADRRRRLACVNSLLISEWRIASTAEVKYFIVLSRLQRISR
jgi:hypothetical protein